MAKLNILLKQNKKDKSTNIAPLFPLKKRKEKEIIFYIIHSQSKSNS